MKKEQTIKKTTAQTSNIQSHEADSSSPVTQLEDFPDIVQKQTKNDADSAEADPSSRVLLVDYTLQVLSADAMLETGLDSSSCVILVSSDDSHNDPGSDSASSVSLLEDSKGKTLSSPSDPQASSVDESQEVKFQ